MAATKVLAALSGGVDSSVCVKLLQDKGYDVSGVVMKMSPLHDKTVKAAETAAGQLGIKLFVLDLQKEFEETIIKYFINEYNSGRTPSPCIMCNPKIKFKYLLKTADENGFDKIATGHYAKTGYENGAFRLFKGSSPERDQSYMLFGLNQDVLSKLLLPLGGYQKSDIRKIAEKSGLDCHDSPDSQENCFIEHKSYAEYIEEKAGPAPKGEFIAPDGTVCGTHKGIFHYTVGQRKGLGIALGRPAFITSIDAESNRIYLGFENETITSVTLKNVNEIYSGAIKDGGHAGIKLRSTGKIIPCSVHKTDEGICKIKLDQPQKKVSRGQGGCLYKEDEVLGGGIIS